MNRDHEIQSDVFSRRVLVFLETAPQSGVYNQVLFDRKQYKQMTATIGKKTGRKVWNGVSEVDEIRLELSVDEHELPDLQQIDYGGNS